MLNSSVRTYVNNTLVEAVPYRLNVTRHQRRLASIKEVAREVTFNTQMNEFLFTDDPSLEKELTDTNFYVGVDMSLLEAIELNGM